MPFYGSDSIGTISVEQGPRHETGAKTNPPTRAPTDAPTDTPTSPPTHASTDAPTSRPVATPKIFVGSKLYDRNAKDCNCVKVSYPYGNDSEVDGWRGCKVWKIGKIPGILEDQQPEISESHKLTNIKDLEVIKSGVACKVESCPEPETLNLGPCQFLAIQKILPNPMSGDGYKKSSKWCSSSFTKEGIQRLNYERRRQSNLWSKVTVEKSVLLHRMSGFSLGVAEDTRTDLISRHLTRQSAKYSYLQYCAANFNFKKREFILGEGYCVPDKSILGNHQQCREHAYSTMHSIRSKWPNSWQHFALDCLGRPAIAKWFFHLDANFIAGKITRGGPPALWWLQHMGINQMTMPGFSGCGTYKDVYMLSINPPRLRDPVEFEAMSSLFYENSTKPILPELEKKKPLLLWLSRKDTSNRKLLNEDECMDIAKKFISDNNLDIEFYEYVGSKESKDPAKMLELFQRAKILAGPHGGQWAYLAFANPEACCIELAADAPSDRFKTYWYYGWTTGIGGRNDLYSSPTYGGATNTAQASDLTVALARCLGIEIEEKYSCVHLHDEVAQLKDDPVFEPVPPK